MRDRALAASTLVLVLMVLGSVAGAHPSWAGSQNGAATVPTLDGIGLATLGSAVAMAGAWLVARKRNKE